MAISNPTLTYVSLEDAKALNVKLANVGDDELTRLLYTSEEVIDAYIASYTPEDQVRTFPRAEDEGDIPYNIQLSTSLLAEYIQGQQAVGDLTMGGMITSEKGLERSVTYAKNDQGFLASVTNNMPYTIKALLERYKGGGGDLSGFNMLRGSDC